MPHPGPAAVRPRPGDGALAGNPEVLEISPSALRELVSSAGMVQAELSSIPIDERLQVIEHIARVWKQKLDRGDLEELKRDMSASTGYSPALMETELSFVPAVLGAANIRKNLDASVQGGADALFKFVEVDETEMFRHVPIGPVLIISSGNSIVPTLIPTVVSLVTGNLTILKTIHRQLSRRMRGVQAAGGCSGLQSVPGHALRAGDIVLRP